MMIEFLQRITSLDTLTEFVHSSVDKLLDIPVRGNLTHLEWTDAEIAAAQDNINTLFCSCVVMNDTEVDKELTSHLHVLSARQQKCVLDCLHTRKDEIIKYLLKNINSKNTPLLRDFDWKLLWVLGSSSLAAKKEPLLQVDLICDPNLKTRSINNLKNGSLETIHLELSKEELYTVIHTLDKALDLAKNTK